MSENKLNYEVDIQVIAFTPTLRYMLNLAIRNSFLVFFLISFGFSPFNLLQGIFFFSKILVVLESFLAEIKCSCFLTLKVLLPSIKTIPYDGPPRRTAVKTWLGWMCLKCISTLIGWLRVLLGVWVKKGKQKRKQVYL